MTDIPTLDQTIYRVIDAGFLAGWISRANAMEQNCMEGCL